MTAPRLVEGDARSTLIERLERAVELAAQEMRRDFLVMVRPYNLTLTQVSVLLVLRERGEPTRISELGDATLTPASSMTHAIDRLVQDGLIERHEDEHDRRASLVTLTAAGQKIVDEIDGSHRQYFKTRCETLEESELELLVKLFELFSTRPPLGD
jgi:DNA-binding MarR family transcriptional regulator